MNIIPDISEIGEFVYSWDFDAEEYNEYLQENGLVDSQEELMNYIEEQVSFDVDFLDNVTYHTFDSLSMSLDEIRGEYGDKLADTILKDCMNDGEGRIETELIIGDEDIDLNNDTQVNAVAKKLFQQLNRFFNLEMFYKLLMIFFFIQIKINIKSVFFWI